MRRAVVAAVAAVAVGALALVGGAALTAAAAFTCPVGARCFAAGYTHPIYVGSRQVYAPSSSVTPSTTPSTTTTAPASTTTTGPSSTTTTTAPTTSSAAPPPPTTAPSTTTATTPGLQFSEPFTGNVGLDRFRHGIYNRNLAVGYPAGHDFTTEWMADHDMNCGAPTTHRMVTGDPANADALFYPCANHLMTVVGDWDSYSLAFFSPVQTFATVNQVCWDVNLTDEGNRLWWDVSIVPTSAGDLFAPSWLAGAGNAGGAAVKPYESSSGVHFAWGPFSHHLEIGSRAGLFDDSAHEYTSGTDVATRFRNCVTNNGDGTATWAQQQGASTYRYTAAVAWPVGPLKVVFAHHAYTPTKDVQPTSFTFHWDQIEVS